MARTNATNFSGALQFPMANAATDAFKKEDVQTLALAVDQHDHSTGKGPPVSAGSIPNGTITSAMIQDGTIATADLANNAVTNQKLGTDTARLNLLTNGGFEIWQRGNGPFTANGVYAADRWWVLPTAPTTTSVTRDTANVDGGSIACAAVVVGAYAAESYLSQRVEDFTQLRGRTITFSIRGRSSVANGLRLAIGQTSGSTFGAYHSGGGAYETLSVTVAIAANTSIVQCNVSFDANGTYYLDNAMLVVGSVAADYAPLHPADDLARCQRYYEVITGNFGFPMLTGTAAATSQGYGQSMGFKAAKPVSPTVTKIGTWTTVNAVQPTTPYTSGWGLYIQTVPPAAGYFQCYPPDTTAYVTVEANP